MNAVLMDNGMEQQRNKKILIVDDDAGLQLVVAKRLKGAGFTCESALTVEDGLVLVREWQPELVILDLGFVGSDGADFIQSIRLWTPAGQKIPPIIVLSCFNEKDIVDYVLDLGACDFISKPYGPEDLVNRVRNHLST